MITESEKRRFYAALISSAIFLLGYSLVVLIYSPHLTYDAEPSRDLIYNYVSLKILVGIVYTFAVIILIRSRIFNHKYLVIVFFIGILSRIILIPSEPILEDDFNRYLWDGAVTANGINPYDYPPDLFKKETSVKNDVPEILYMLADSSGQIINKINHPHIRSIYPPVAQSVFAISYIFDPWSISFYKIILLILDIVIFILLIRVLKMIKYPKLLVSVYWLNPILLHEIFNAGHMDIIIYPFLLAGILFLFAEKYVKSAALFSLAAGVKVWPIIFLPFVFQKAYVEKKFIPTFLISIIIITLLFIPILSTNLDDSLGFITYTKNWSNNESIFRIISLTVNQGIDLFNISYKCSHCVARWITVFAFILLLIKFLRMKNDGNEKIINKFFYLLAVLFIISPTQFPWYYTWILPLLTLNPRLSFIAYSIFLPLYHLNYTYGFIVWIEHIPIIILFLMELRFEKLRNILRPNYNRSIT